VISYEWLAWVGHIATVVVGFGFLIFIHEFGHFIFAKWKGVRVIKFSLGFGPALIRHTVGETEYAISIVPLGGYCKLAGEMIEDKEPKEDEKKGEPPEDPSRLLSSKSVGARALIFAAGAMMNLAVAFPLGIIAVLIAGQPIPKVTVNVGPAYVAGIQTGDLVTTVNGKPVQTWDEMTDVVEASPVGAPFPVTVKRGNAERTYSITRKEKDNTLGLGLFKKTTVGWVSPIGAAQRAGLKAGDIIMIVTKPGQDPIPVNEWNDFESTLRSSPGEELTVKLQRGDKIIEKKVVPKLEKEIDERGRAIYGLGVTFKTEPVIAEVQGESPAAVAGLKAGDRVVSVSGRPIKDWGDITAALKASGVTIPMSVTRDGKKFDIVVTRESPQSLIGIAGSGADSYPVIDRVTEKSAAMAAGLQPGDTIMTIDDKDVKALPLREWFPNHGEQTVQVKRGDQVLNVKVTPAEEYASKIGVAPKVEFRKQSVFTAVVAGVYTTRDMIVRTVDILGGLFLGQVSTRELAGPVAIVTLSYREAQAGWEQFIGFMMMISISLGIFNLLPVPVLDGGHLLFLLIEKIKGKPVSERTFVVAQYVGMVFLIGLVLFVTHNDVVRFILKQ